jgi:RHS repeat-associated protein
VTYIHTDGLGSPVARTNEKGELISRTRYEPYGATAGGATPGIGFTGHVNDPETGLTYMQQRYYDPLAGRFLSVDPVLTDANTGASFNRYVYAINNPYKYIDPDGREVKIVGTPSFKQLATAAMNKIESGKRGKVIVAAANDAKKTITIKESTGTNNTIRPVDSNIKPSDSTIQFNPSNTTGGVDINGGVNRPAFVGLAHELGHAVAAANGQHSNDRGNGELGTTPPSEKQPMLFENAVRKDNDLPPRAPYFTKPKE